MAIRDDGKEAITFVKLKEKIQGYSVLNISIQTGRTHQIRVHLASKKLPIIGDKTYNPRKVISKDTSENLVKFIRNFPRQALHATSIAFKDMKSESVISYKSDIPLDMQTLISKLKKL